MALTPIKNTFPVLNADSVLVDNDGKPTKEFINYLSILHNKLTDNLSSNGVRVPVITTDTANQILQGDRKSVPVIVHNSTTNKYQVVIQDGANYVFKNIMLET